MNGAMVRNDITIPLISCQFETSTVFILERLFVFFVMGGGRAEVKKEAFLLPRVSPACISRAPFALLHLKKMTFPKSMRVFFPQSMLVVEQIILFSII